MQRLTLTCVLALALLPDNVSACTCRKADGPPSEIGIVHEYCEYDRVFIGKPYRVSAVETGRDTRDYYLSVDESYKGNMDEFVVIRSTGCCACDAHFEVGVPSLIFANVREGDAEYLQASFCSLTRRLEYSKDVIAVLEQLTNEEGDPCSETSLRKWTDVTKQREIDEMRSLQAETMELLREVTRSPQ